MASQMFELWIAHALVAGGWLAVWGGVVATLHRKVDLARYRPWLNGLGGVVMIGLGIRATAK